MAGISLRAASFVLLIATSASFAQTTTTPTTSSANTVKVKRGDLEQKIVTTGTFEPVDAFEVRIRPKSYMGELLIVRAIAPGAAVGKGETVLELDRTWIDRQIASAENDLTAAKANYEKAQADTRLGDDADALAMKIQEQELKDAQSSLTWWEKVDGKQILQNAELAVQGARDSVEDQTDELDQLKKMYKSEELTNATADIVVKRALRALKRSKIGAEMAEARADKTKQNDWQIYHSKFVNKVDEEKQALDRLKVAQQQAKIMRQIALTGVKLGLDGAEEKLRNLKNDLEFFAIKSPQSLTYFYGKLENGGWQNNNPRALKIGERIALQPPQAPPAVWMTGFVPGKLKLLADIPESKALQVEPGLKAKVIPIAQSYTLVEGTTGPRSPEPSPGGSSYQMPIELTIPAKIEPGMKASITIEAPKAANVLVVPSSAVKDQKVWKRQPDGTDKQVDVVTGRSQDELVEIISGLSEGDEILKDGKKG